MHAIEELVSRRQRPEELQGIIAEAKTLAQQWKNPHSAKHSKDQRPLFDENSSNTTFLLAALVVALRQDHEFLEPIRRRFPEELENLSDAVRYAQIREWAESLGRARPKLTSGQNYERDKRPRWRRSRFNSIEYQFGGGLEADLQKRMIPFRPDDPASGQNCLDDIFAGKTVNMHRLENLFYGIERHQLGKLMKRTGIEIKTGRNSRFGPGDVCKILDWLLQERPRRKAGKKAGRPPAPPWLNDANLRSRVLRAIEARIVSIDNLLLSIVAGEVGEVEMAKLSDWELSVTSTIIDNFPGYGAWKEAVGERFLAVLGHYLPDSGKK
jgi:hypothetical protein